MSAANSIRIPANVRRGVALLDERLPGWRGRINRNKLDLANECQCVIGQVLGTYSDGTDLLGMETTKDAARYGFTTAPRQTFDALTAAWRKVLS